MTPDLGHMRNGHMLNTPNSLLKMRNLLIIQTQEGSSQENVFTFSPIC